ncbi:MAG: metallopeptidase [Mariniblastus sp.]|nr:metallopeptidase [Mariniblastus sp.]
MTTLTHYDCRLLAALLAILLPSPLTGDEPVFYDPVQIEVEGWTVQVDPALMRKESQGVREQALAALGNHLQRVKFIVPGKQLAKLQALPIWIDLEHPVLKNMQYHPNRQWLIAHQHDPRLVKHVHIPQARQLYARNMWAKHPYVVLHELAHAYHDQVIGFQDEAIEQAYRAARKSGRYNEVLLHTGQVARHYGMNNAKEYFAESTEAYLGVNDFYPFVRAELREHDPDMFRLMQTIWGSVR